MPLTLAFSLIDESEHAAAVAADVGHRNVIQARL